MEINVLGAILTRELINHSQHNDLALCEKVGVSTFRTAKEGQYVVCVI